MKNGQCLDNAESKSYNLTEKGGTITFSGWSLKNPKALIWEELEEYYDEYEIFAFEITKVDELAYSCPRFSNGEDAREEGYKSWMNYHTVWKRGLGKCTEFTIAYKLKPQHN